VLWEVSYQLRGAGGKSEGESDRVWFSACLFLLEVLGGVVVVFFLLYQESQGGIPRA